MSAVWSSSSCAVRVAAVVVVGVEELSEGVDALGLGAVGVGAGTFLLEGAVELL